MGKIPHNKGANKKLGTLSMKQYQDKYHYGDSKEKALKKAENEHYKTTGQKTKYAGKGGAKEHKKVTGQETHYADSEDYNKAIGLESAKKFYKNHPGW